MHDVLFTVKSPANSNVAVMNMALYYCKINWSEWNCNVICFI